MNKLRSFLSLFLLIFLTSDAFAAQSLIRAIDTENGSADGSYLSTPTKVYTADGWVSKFSNDGNTNYPDEIYLPNERHPENYRIHTNYTKNTDACASCHATHTAVGDSLLQWYTNYETCMACHDGTVTTTYNVAEGMLPGGQLAAGGAFGTGKERYSSYHNVTGGVLIGSAPGNDTDLGNHNDKPLGCASCHSPHGLGGNARLLNPDPNGVQSMQANQFKNYELVEIDNSSVLYVTYAAYPKKDGAYNLQEDPYYMLNGYPYKVTVSVNDQEYQGYNDVFKIDNTAGFTKVNINKTEVAAISSITASFIPSLRVRMNITNYLGAGGPEEVAYRDGSVKFCSACHDTYKDKETVNMSAYRHPVDVSISGTSVESSIYRDSPLWVNEMQYKFETNSKMVCLTCHVAHGTSSEYWQLTIEYTPDATKEVAGSSALKRAPNSDLCEVCHNKQQHNEGYNANTSQPHNEQEYAANEGLFTQSLGISSYKGTNAVSCYSKNGSLTCHSPIVDTWKATLHATSMGTAIAAAARDNQPLANEFYVETGITEEQVLYVIGDKRSQRYVYDDNGTLKVAKNEFVFSDGSWLVKDPKEFIKDCAGCHVTGLNIASSTWKDDGVACEACHGSAGNHITVPSSRNITNPRYLSVNDQIDICAQCHTFGFNKDINNIDYPYPIGYMPYAEGLRDNVSGSTYELSNFFIPYAALAGGEYPGNFYDAENLNSPTYDSAYSAQEFNDFRQSKHYQSGAVSCVTCHSSHDHNFNGQMLKLTQEQTCGACHGTSFDLDVVMPKRIAVTNNPVDSIRVHTFAKQHSNDVTNTGAHKEVH